MLSMKLIADGRPVSDGPSHRSGLAHVELFNDMMVKAMGPLGRRSAALFAGRIKMRIGREIRARAKNRTGALERSWRVQTTSTGAVLSSNSPYALMREHGGIIRARKKPWLRFKVNGRWVRTKQVRQRGWGYIRKALEASLPDAEKTFRRNAVLVVRKAVQRINGMKVT